MVPGLRGAAEIGFGLRQQIERAEQVLAREPAGERRQAIALALGGDLGILHPGGIDPDDQQVAHQARQLAADQAEVVAELDGPARERERRRGILVGHGPAGIEHQIAPDEAEHRRDVAGADRAPRERNHLVELALRVAHAAVRAPRDEVQRLVRRLDALGVHDPAELVHDRLRADRAQLVDLRARQHGIGDLLELGRRHHENDVRRRLLDRLEQRVERVGRELVDLVDDEHLVAVADRQDVEPRDDHLADVVHLRVRGGVDLEGVDVTPLGDLDAGIAGAARLSRRALHAVQRARQDAGRRRLADATRSREDEGLRETAARQRVPQGARHRLLPDDVVEALGPPLARQDLVGHLR